MKRALAAVVSVGAMLACGDASNTVEPTFDVRDVEVDIDTSSVDAPETCGDCNDGDDCTRDFCVDGVCAHVGIFVEQACLTDAHCDDGDSCTIDACAPFSDCGFDRCSNEPIACDDGDPCTRDFCTASGGCTSVAHDVWLGCQVDADCDDADPCTADRCRPIEDGCDRSRCVNDRDFQCGTTCETTADCPRLCRESSCYEGRCVDGAPIAGCDLACSNADTMPADQILGGPSIRGIAAAAVCDTCPCTSALEIAGTVLRRPLFDITTFEPFGGCAVETCGETPSCTPLVAGRGYIVRGQPGPNPAGSRDEPSMLVHSFCLATSSELMVGDWAGTLTIDGDATSFDAWVAPVDDDDNLTRMAVAATPTGIGIPAQTVHLPDGGVHLDTAIETDLGTFTGTLYTTPDALVGDVYGPGLVGVLSFRLR